jgi:hypothetical protein
VYDLQPQQLKQIEILMDLASKINEGQLPVDYQLAGPPMAGWLAVAYHTMNELEYGDVAFSFVAATGRTVMLDFNKLRVADTMIDALRFGYGIQIVPSGTRGNLVLASREVAQEVAAFLHNIRNVALYAEYQVMARGDGKLLELALKLADHEEYQDYTHHYDEEVAHIFEDQRFNAAYAIVICQAIMELLDIPGPIGFQYAEVSGHYHDGGGGCVVGKDSYVLVDTDWFINGHGAEMLAIAKEQDDEEREIQAEHMLVGWVTQASS